MDFDLVVADVRHAGAACDIGIAGGRIAAIAPPGTLVSAAIEAGQGRLALPGLVDGHIHLDKTFLGLPWIPHRPDPSIAGRIAAEAAQRRAIAEPMALRARRLAEHVVARGTTAIRTHVDIDPALGLAGLHDLLALRQAMLGVLDIQIVAFPQSGVMIAAGTADLLDQAVRQGADVVGGLDPACIDDDVEGQLSVVFGIAERHGVPIDIHLHDPGELGAWELRRIAARAKAAGLQGRVAVSHAYALGDVAEGTLARTAAALAAGGVAIMTNGPGDAPMPPVLRLRAEGVTVFAGSDNIRDAWSPFGDGDMLRRAGVIGYRSGMATDTDLAVCLDLVTAAPARVMGRAAPAIAVGAPADLVLVAAEGVPEAVATAPPRALVVKSGRVVARSGIVAA